MTTVQVEYRTLAEFPGYRVGDDGTVWSCRIPGSGGRLSDVWNIRKPSRLRGGYLGVLLYDRFSRPRHVQIHRLVLEAFVGPCPPGMQCCHWDGDPTNNRPSNLRWDTRKANAADTIRLGRQPMGASHGGTKLREEQVMEIKGLLSEGMPRAAIARRFAVCAEAINAIACGETWKHLPTPSLPTPSRSHPLRFGPGRLSGEQAESIRRRHAGGESQKILALAFGVSISTVSRIVNGLSHGGSFPGSVESA